jgi:cell wall-associated NlpC family hydrolase
MIRVRSRSPLAAFAVRAVLAAVVMVTASLQITRPAHADALTDAKTKARQLQTQVTQLQLKAEQASEKYDAAEAGLAQLIAEQQQAIRAAAAATASAARNQTAVYSRTRALYTSGGMIGIYATVINGHDPRQVLDGLHSMQALSDADKQALHDVDSSALAAHQANADVAALSAKQDVLTAAAAAAAEDAQSALAEQQQALADSTAEVATIEAQLQKQADADAAARAASDLLTAEHAAVTAGFIVVQASPFAARAITAARQQVGKPYVFGGSGPDTWDCSGLTQWAFEQAGVLLPRTAADQYAAVQHKVPLGQLQAGDLLFWATDTSDPATIHHVAIYLGNGVMLAAPHTGTDVQIQPVYLDGYLGAVRVG